MELILYATGILLFLLTVAACSVLETALISTTKLTFIKHETRKGQDRTDFDVFDLWEEHSDEMLIALIIINNLAQTFFVACGVVLSIKLFPATAVLKTVIPAGLLATLVVIIFGEIIPKSFARKYAETIAFTIIRPLHVVVTLLRPVIAPFIFLLSLIHKEKDQNHFMLDEPFITPEKLADIMEMGQQEGTFEEEQGEMITSIFEFGNRIIREVMRPRTDMVCIEADTPLKAVPEFFREYHKSRIPVSAQKKDHILGVLYARDFFLHFDRINELCVRDIMRKATYVPETAYIEDILKMFQTQKKQIAIVVDEFGGTAGLVTMEDIIEEIFGEIEDEHDLEESENIRKKDKDTHIVAGRTPIYDLEEIDVFLPKEDDYDTISGFLQNLLGFIPAKGEEIAFGDYVFTILEEDSKTIRKVKITTVQHPTQEAEDDKKE